MSILWNWSWNIFNPIDKIIQKAWKLLEFGDFISIIQNQKDFIILIKILFTLKSNLSRHLKICKVKKNNIEEENKKLKEKVELLELKLKNPNVVINNTNSNNQTNLIINLAPWNDPKLPNDVEKYYREAVKKIFLAVPTLIKYIHFNTEHPENHNICIKNGRSKTAKVYNGKEWETIDEDRLIRTLIDDYESTLTDYASEKILSITKKCKK